MAHDNHRHSVGEDLVDQEAAEEVKAEVNLQGHLLETRLVVMGYQQPAEVVNLDDIEYIYIRLLLRALHHDSKIKLEGLRHHPVWTEYWLQ